MFFSFSFFGFIIWKLTYRIVGSRWEIILTMLPYIIANLFATILSLRMIPKSMFKQYKIKIIVIMIINYVLSLIYNFAFYIINLSYILLGF